MSAQEPGQNPKRGLEQSSTTEQTATKKLKTKPSSSSSASSDLDTKWPQVPWNLPPGQLGYNWLAAQVNVKSRDHFDSVVNVLERGFFDAIEENVRKIDFNVIRQYSHYHYMAECATVNEYFLLLCEYLIRNPVPSTYMCTKPRIHTYLANQAFFWFVNTYSPASKRSVDDWKTYDERQDGLKRQRVDRDSTTLKAFALHPCLLVCDRSITCDVVDELTLTSRQWLGEGSIELLVNSWNTEIAPRWLPLIPKTLRTEFKRPMQIARILSVVTNESKEATKLEPLTLNAKFMRDCAALGFVDEDQTTSSPLLHSFFCSDSKVLQFAARQFQHKEDNVEPFSTPFFQYFLDYIDTYTRTLVDLETAKVKYLNNVGTGINIARNDPYARTNLWATRRSLVPILLREIGVDFFGYEVFVPNVWRFVEQNNDDDKVHEIDQFWWYMKAKIDIQNDKAKCILGETHGKLLPYFNGLSPLVLISLGYLYGRSQTMSHPVEKYKAVEDFTANVIFKKYLFAASPLIERYNREFKGLEDFTFVVEDFEMGHITGGENVFSDEEEED